MIILNMKVMILKENNLIVFILQNIVIMYLMMNIYMAG